MPRTVRSASAECSRTRSAKGRSRSARTRTTTSASTRTASSRRSVSARTPATASSRPTMRRTRSVAPSQSRWRRTRWASSSIRSPLPPRPPHQTWIVRRAPKPRASSTRRKRTALPRSARSRRTRSSRARPPADPLQPISTALASSRPTPCDWATATAPDAKSDTICASANAAIRWSRMYVRIRSRACRRSAGLLGSSMAPVMSWLKVTTPRPRLSQLARETSRSRLWG